MHSPISGTVAIAKGRLEPSDGQVQCTYSVPGTLNDPLELLLFLKITTCTF